MAMVCCQIEETAGEFLERTRVKDSAEAVNSCHGLLVLYTGLQLVEQRCLHQKEALCSCSVLMSCI